MPLPHLVGWTCAHVGGDFHQVKIQFITNHAVHVSGHLVYSGQDAHFCSTPNRNPIARIIAHSVTYDRRNALFGNRADSVSDGGIVVQDTSRHLHLRQIQGHSVCLADGHILVAVFQHDSRGASHAFNRSCMAEDIFQGFLCLLLGSGHIVLERWVCCNTVIIQATPAESLGIGFDVAVKRLLVHGLQFFLRDLQQLRSSAGQLVHGKPHFTGSDSLPLGHICDLASLGNSPGKVLDNKSVVLLKQGHDVIRAGSQVLRGEHLFFLLRGRVVRLGLWHHGSCIV